MLKQTAFTIAAAGLIIGQTGLAAEKGSVEFPAELPPTIAIAQFEAGNLTLTHRKRRMVPETVTVQVPIQRQINGKQVTEFVAEQRTRYRKVDEKSNRVFKSDEFFLYDTEGQQIPKADLAIILKTPRVVLVSADGLPIAPFYRPLFQADALVVVPKQQKKELKPGEFRPKPASKVSGVRSPVKPAAKEKAR